MIKKRKEKQGFWKRNYLEVWDYIKDSRKYIYWAVGIFVFFILIGSIIPVPESISIELDKFIKELIEKTQGFSNFEMIKFLFINNSFSSLSSILLGVFLGIFPIIAITSNGYLLGYVSRMVINEAGFLELWRLLPHGIFELPAALISFALGIKFGFFIFSKNPKNEFAKRFFLGIKTFFFVVLPLLIIAAIIEGLLIGFLS